MWYMINNVVELPLAIPLFLWGNYINPGNTLSIPSHDDDWQTYPKSLDILVWGDWYHSFGLLYLIPYIDLAFSEKVVNSRIVHIFNNWCFSFGNVET